MGRGDVDPDIYAREIARYKWAAQFTKSGDRVLEFGCSSGFGTMYLPADVHYIGADYSREIVKYATEQFGDERHAFIWSSIDKYLEKIERLDVIIAFEVLEHVRNGRELAQELKKHCKTLLLSTPYREPPGFWGAHHVLHQLTEKDFPQFKYSYMHMPGNIESYPVAQNPNLLMMEWHEGETYKERKRILCSIPTKNRYDALMHCLQAIAFQSVKPDKVCIYDDGERKDLREHDIGRYMLPLLNRHGIEWEVLFTPGRGQHVAHQMANTAGYDYVWRLDDDSLPEPDVLERLLAHMADDVGAVGGAVYEIERQFPGGTSKIADFFHGGNVQWAPNQGTHEVDFLYSSFLYRAGIVNYKSDMSQVAFHEESIFTHRLKRAGWKLIADTSIHTLHFKARKGGTREADYKWAYAFDHREFMEIMEKEFSVKLIHLGVGLGDCLAFRNILPELKQKYETVVIGSIYPEVFENDDVVLIPYEKAKEQSKENVYDEMSQWNWRGHIVEAYRKMYLQ